MLDIEGADGPADVAILGNESEVERQIRELAAVGTTDFVPGLFPTDGDAEASMKRTRALLKSLVGKV